MFPRLRYPTLPLYQDGQTQEPWGMSPSQVKTGSWSSRPIHWYLRHFPPLHLPHHTQPEELPSICDCPGSLGGQSCVLIKSVGGKERGKDPFLYWGGRDLKEPSLLAPAHIRAHHTPTDTKPHISTRGHRCTDTKTQTHRHTQKDTQRHIHTHTEGTHRHTYAHTDISLGNTGWLSQPSHLGHSP